MPFSSVSWALGWGSRRGSVAPLDLDFFVPLEFDSAGIEALRFASVADFFGGIVRRGEVEKGDLEIRSWRESNWCCLVRWIDVLYAKLPAPDRSVSIN